MKSYKNILYGAGGGTRTHTMSPSTDFESVTSANSITPAATGSIIHYKKAKIKCGQYFLKTKLKIATEKTGENKRKTEKTREKQ